MGRRMNERFGSGMRNGAGIFHDTVESVNFVGMGQVELEQAPGLGIELRPEIIEIV